jgi:hypothetical protein
MFKNRYKAIGTILKKKPEISTTPEDLDDFRHLCKIFKIIWVRNRRYK